MIEFVSNFTNQLNDAKTIGSKLLNKTVKKDIQNVIICGLGGSGIGGKIASKIAELKCEKPVLTYNSYSLPAFVSNNTLVIISSYSGDTEETISALKEAIKRNCEIICITSGGEVKEIADRNSVEVILVPGGNPPRAMLTYSLTQLLFIFQYYSLIKLNALSEINNTILLLNEEEKKMKEEAKKVANQVKNTTILIYTDASFEGVGTRFKQQLNENTKTLAFANVIPEMNHNELLGWQGGSKAFSSIFLRNTTDNKRNQLRMDISKNNISKIANSCVEIHSKGNTEVERIFYFILMTDWISIYLAEIYNVDSIEIKVIDNLKNLLRKN
jgi:glucose/mannose-6-phosphate isomerase